MNLNLKELENESISIIRSVLRHAANPLILYSIGKDSSVLMHLFLKAFYPLRMSVKVLHVDTTWKFKEMITFRDEFASSNNLDLIIHTNLEGVKQKINPFEHENYTDIMKTDALVNFLKHGHFDFIFGGARRDEEQSRAKERVLSYRNKNEVWEPTNQNIEPWHHFNVKNKKDGSYRVFPLSNWTELDIWQYIKYEEIKVVPLYFAKERPVVKRNGQFFLPDDSRFILKENEKIETKVVRFRTLGCYPLTAAIESTADNIDKVIREVNNTNFSERSGRLIDHDKDGSMEIKKKQGYF